jgi:hypothetical protein
LFTSAPRRARNILLDSRWGVAVPLDRSQRLKPSIPIPGSDGVVPSMCAKRVPASDRF